MPDLPRYSFFTDGELILNPNGSFVKWADVSARLQQLEQEKATLLQENVRLCRALGAREIRVPQPAAPVDAGKQIDGAEGENPRTIYRSRTEEELHAVLSMLCHFVWHRELRPGEHMWSIPADRERDFDCILSDGIHELSEARAALAETREALQQLTEKYEEILARAGETRVLRDDSVPHSRTE